MGAVVELKTKDEPATTAEEKTERWGRIPIRTAKMAQLGGVALRVLIAISAHAVSRSCRTPPLSMTDIADLTGVIRGNIPRAVQQLELAGLIRAETRRDGTVYTILLDAGSSACGVITHDDTLSSPVRRAVITHDDSSIDTEKRQKEDQSSLREQRARGDDLFSDHLPDEGKAHRARTSQTTPRNPKAVGVARATLETYQPGKEILAWAASNAPGVDVRGCIEQWRDYHRAKGTRIKDYDASLRTWLRNEVKFAAHRSARPANRKRRGGLLDALRGETHIPDDNRTIDGDFIDVTEVGHA